MTFTEELKIIRKIISEVNVLFKQRYNFDDYPELIKEILKKYFVDYERVFNLVYIHGYNEKIGYYYHKVSFVKYIEEKGLLDNNYF